MRKLGRRDRRHQFGGGNRGATEAGAAGDADSEAGSRKGPGEPQDRSVTTRADPGRRGGRTLYLFTQDKPHRALCTSDYLNCTKIWLPLMTTGRPHGEAGVKAGLLGTFHRTKPAGSQVTYNGHPLYLYVDDKQPGDLEGQTLYDYWYVLSASGRPITRK